MPTFFPDPIWRQIIDYWGIHHDIHHERLFAVNNQLKDGWEAVFDSFFAMPDEYRSKQPLEWKRDYAWDACVTVAREMLPVAVFVPYGAFIDYAASDRICPARLPYYRRVPPPPVRRAADS
mgnify:CR=1 FL=1